MKTILSSVKSNLISGYTITIAVALLLPIILSSFQMQLMAKIFVFAILGISYDLIWGYAGISNFGHALFFGLGAYGFGLVMKNVRIPAVTYIAILAALLLPAIVGMLISWLLHYKKVGGAFFAVVTMSLSVVFESIAMAWTNVTGGMNGLYGYQPAKLGIPGIFEFRIDGFTSSYYSTLVCLCLVSFLVLNLLNRRYFGRVISALKNDEIRLQYLGYNSSQLKTTIFTLSCAIAGFAGFLYAQVSTINPSTLGLGMSIQILVWVTVGGRGSIIGPIVGAVLVNLMEEFLSGYLLNFWMIILGLFFIAIVMFWPQGAVGWVRHMISLINQRRHLNATRD